MVNLNNHSKDQLDFLSLALQNGHVGWHSVKLVLHLGQYQAMASSRTLISDVSQVREEETLNSGTILLVQREDV